MAEPNLIKRIAELEAEIERLSGAQSLRRRLGGKLTARKLKTFNQPGRIIGDGNNLLYKCGGRGRGCWIYRYKAQGKAYDIGLGGYPAVSLADARTARDEHRHLRNQGQDPHAERQRETDAARLTHAKARTFAQCAEGYFQAHAAGWRSAKHRHNWMQIVTAYIDPVIGSLPVDAIDTGHIMRIIEPLWLGSPEGKRKTETASRARQIIEATLDFAKARNFRSGENPARWRGHLENLLPRKTKVRAVIHHAALPWPELRHL